MLDALSGDRHIQGDPSLPLTSTINILEAMSDSHEPREHTLGPYLKALRLGLRMTLRDVEEATGREVSNAYLSQLENGKIARPSPHVLHALSQVYEVSYATVMQRAGYVSPVETRTAGEHHGKKAATFAVENLTPDEEKALLEYLSFLRSRRGAG